MPDWPEHLLPGPKERVRELSEDEEAAIEEHLREDYRPLRRFSLVTGLRMTEAYTLTWGQVDWENRTVSIVGKGDKPDVIPLHSEGIALLALLRGHHTERVFTYVAARRRDGRSKGKRYPITRNGLSTQWRRTRARAMKDCPSLKSFRGTTTATRRQRECCAPLATCAPSSGFCVTRTLPPPQNMPTPCWTMYEPPWKTLQDHGKKHGSKAGQSANY